MEQFIGSFVSIDCGSEGIFQGQILLIDGESQNITLQRVFCNGSPCSSNQVLISAKSIKNLEILKVADEPGQSKPVQIKKPIPKRASAHSNLEGFHIKDISRKPEERGTSSAEGNRTPSKKDKQRQRFLERDEAAFGLPMERNMDDDFDFEKNLALFNKKAVYDEINASKPDVVRQTDKRNTKYRWDENVLAPSKPSTLRQIVVPFPLCNEYVTDSGLIVPCVTQEVRNRILSTAERLGLTLERQSELVGRAASEIALLLLGGAHRLNPHNLHQCPSVAILCGSHRPGSLALNCARHLATHGVRTTVYIENQVTLPAEMTFELALYKLTCNKVTSTVQDLSTAPVDLIILALSDTNSSNTSSVTPAAKWANQNRAQVLAIDPPPQGTPGVSAKYSLVSILPLAHSQANGKIYLCNLGIPLQVYKETGITYCSPFGPKFFVPLHPNDS